VAALAKLHSDRSRVIASLSSKLRLTAQSRYRPNTAATATEQPRRVLRAASPTQETADPGPALWQPYTLSYPVSAGLFLCAESAPELSRRCALARD
jgi:hypothetical protein